MPQHRFVKTPINTRFNPTINGDLHLGHLYLCLVNEYEAHRTGGMFTVRFDDSHPCTMQWASNDLDKIARCCEQQLADLEQFMTVDYSWSELKNKWRLAQMPKVMVREWKYMDSPFLYPEMIQFPSRLATGAGEMYPYVPGYTAEKVFMDIMTGVNWLIRGDDLMSEFALYNYFNEIMLAPIMRHTYLPRLQPASARFDTVNKSQGGYTVRGLVKKHGKEEVLRILCDACLKDPGGPFTVTNIKRKPVLSI